MCWIHDWEVLEETSLHELKQKIEFGRVMTSLRMAGSSDRLQNRVCLKCHKVELQIERARVEIREAIKTKEQRQKAAQKIALGKMSFDELLEVRGKPQPYQRGDYWNPIDRPPSPPMTPPPPPPKRPTVVIVEKENLPAARRIIDGLTEDELRNDDLSPFDRLKGNK